MTGLVHVACGGALHPEDHRRWSIQKTIGQTTQMEPVLTGEMETLHRCETCHRIGVETVPVPGPTPGLADLHGQGPGRDHL